MSPSVPLSCPICLRAHEKQEMIAVHVDHGAVIQHQDVYLCRPCVNAITRAYGGELGAAGGPEPVPEPEPEPEKEAG